MAETKTDTFAELLGALHKGGSSGCWFTSPGERHTWWPVDKPTPIPRGKVNVYFNVNPMTKRKRSNETVAALNCVYADADEPLFAESVAACPPSIIVESSPNKTQQYWLLTEPFLLTAADRKRARQLQKRWVGFVGGDDGAKDLARVLRVPGSVNYKPDYAPDFPTVRILKADFELRYTLEELEALLPPAEPVRPRSEPTQRADNNGRLPYVEAAVRDELAWLVGAPEHKRNDWLFRSAANLGEFVGAGALDQADIERRLTAIALSLGLTERETHATIASGMRTGIAQPRDIPEPHARAREDAETVAQVATKPPSDEPHYFFTQSTDDEGNAQCVNARHRGKFAYCDAFGWQAYTGTHFERIGGELALDQAARETLLARRLAAVKAEREAIVKTSRATAQNVKNAKYMLRSMVVVKTTDFDGEPFLLNVKNGVLDLRTGELVAHESSQRFTYCAAVEYHKDADQTTWKNFVQETTGARVVANYLQQAVGYSLTGDTSEEVMFYIYGPLRSGKGTFTETLLEMLGRAPLATEVDFGTFTRKRDRGDQGFDLAPLAPCRFVAASESRREERLNAEKVKSLTGGNLVRCAFKHKTHFAYRPQFKLWLTSNWSVNADPDDDALWARLRVAQFPYSHLGFEDKALKRRLLEPDVLSGVLAWCVAGALKWQESPVGLCAPAVVHDETKTARAALDFVGQWLAECITRTGDPEHFLANAALYQSYKTWCDGNGVTPKKQHGLTVTLRHKGLDARVVRKEAGKTKRGLAAVQFVGELRDLNL